MMRMRKGMIERVKREGIVDTDKYRYKLRTFNGEHTQVLQIVRLPLAGFGLGIGSGRTSGYGRYHVVDVK